MAAYYSPNDAKVKKALKNQLSMALELYVNQPAVSRNNSVIHWQRTHRYPSSLLNASIRQGPSWNQLLKVESEVPLQLPLLRSAHLSTSAWSPLVVVSAYFQHFKLHSICWCYSAQNFAHVLSEPAVLLLMVWVTPPPASALSKHIQLVTLGLGKLILPGQMMQKFSTDLLGKYHLHLALQRRCIRYASRLCLIYNQIYFIDFGP